MRWNRGANVISLPLPAGGGWTCLTSSFQTSLPQYQEQQERSGWALQLIFKKKTHSSFFSDRLASVFNFLWKEKLQNVNSFYVSNHFFTIDPILRVVQASTVTTPQQGGTRCDVFCQQDPSEPGPLFQQRFARTGSWKHRCQFPLTPKPWRTSPTETTFVWCRLATCTLGILQIMRQLILILLRLS